MFEESLISIIIGVAAFVLILVTTLNFNAALLSLTLIIAIAIFQNSFSRGWLFLFALLALIPATKIGNGSTSIYEVLLTILALVGLVHIVTGNVKMKATKLYFLFFLLILIGVSISVFGYFFDLSINPEIFIFTALFILVLTTMISFQHFFQTKKRIERFFVLLVSIGVAHSLFGITSLILGWQSPTGMGITAGTFQLFSDNLIQHQINGFLGNGYLLKVGENALAPFLLISIPLNIGLLLSLKKYSKKKAQELKVPSFQLFDSIHTKQQKKYWISILESSNKTTFFEKTRSFFTPKVFLVGALTIQIVALVLTFSYVSLVILSVGTFVIAVLLREKTLISISIVILVSLTLVVPSFFSSITAQSEHNISQWLSDFGQIKSNWFWGNGWRIEKTNTTNSGKQIYNSFLLIWNTFGMIGLAVLFGILIQYFRQLRSSYLTSDDSNRMWLIVIIAIFVEFVFLAMTSNSLFFGPAAIVFWLLYAVGFNLQKKTVVFGLTETRLRFQ
ncbi:MAG: hypothetical protein U9O20_02070 [Patescibacteria group bacterium]|nr:hypothetical protein [Patescibacteria group bacterium]